LTVITNFLSIKKVLSQTSTFSYSYDTRFSCCHHKLQHFPISYNTRFSCLQIATSCQGSKQFVERLQQYCLLWKYIHKNLKVWTLH